MTIESWVRENSKSKVKKTCARVCMDVRVYTRDARRPTCDHERDHHLHGHEEDEERGD